MEIEPDRLKYLLQGLTDIYSPSGKEEKITGFAEECLKQAGLPVIRQEVTEGRFNLVVLPQEPEDTDLWFVGHLDTIAAYDVEDYGFHEEDGAVLGLGTADMKGGCAAMMEMFRTLAGAKDRLPRIALALVVGEEGESDGAKELMREYSFPWAIIGEPTDMVPCLGHYGYLEVLLRTEGKTAHSSMPELGQNAIEAMLRLLLRVTEYTTAVREQRLVYNIRQLTGFPTGFVVPNMCEAWLDIHLPPDSRIDLLKAGLEHVVEECDRETPTLNAVIRFEETYSGYRISEERVLVRKLRQVYQNLSMDWRPHDFRSHSDGNVLWNAGVDPIILGPGRLEAAHTPEEAVAFSQVLCAAQLYLDLALAL